MLTVQELLGATSDCSASDITAGVEVVLSSWPCLLEPSPTQIPGQVLWGCSSHVPIPFHPCLPEDKPSSSSTSPAHACLNQRDPQAQCLVA